MCGRLEGKVALVTGAARGIGRAIALRLAAMGAAVVVNDLAPEEAIGAVVAEIEGAGGKALGVRANITVAAEVAAMVEKVVATFGELHILVNNAGITRDMLVMRLSEEDWDAVLTTNLKGAFLCARAAVRPLMKARWGRIVSVSSIVGLVGNAGQANYAAAKAGLIGLTRSLAKELGSRGITANAVAPGFIATDMTAGLPDKVKEEAQARTPAGRLGTPEDVAAAVAFFCSEEASFITGQVLAVDGGMAMG